MLLLRVLLVPLGLGSLLWAAAATLTFWSSAYSRDVTAWILANDRFNQTALLGMEEQLNARPPLAVRRADVQRAEALIGAQRSEELIGRGGSADADHQLESAEGRLRSALAANPTDSFLWLLLYSTATKRNGFDVGMMHYLEQSYATGPLEGWIAIRRNHLALLVLSIFPGEMQQRIVSEFAALVESSFIEEAVASLTGSGWEQRERLLRSLERVDIRSREALAKKLSLDGIEVTVPGVEINERLWR